MPRMGRVPNENRGRNQKPVPMILVGRIKLDPSKGKQLMNILNQLDNNGMYPSERPVPKNDKIRRYEALQNSLR